MRSWTENSAAVARDDALVEALAARRSLPPQLAQDEVARHLAAWTAALDAGLPASATEGRRVAVAGQDRPTTSQRRLSYRLGHRLGHRSPPDHPSAARRPSRVVRRAAVTAAILVLASLGGVTAAERAQPGEVLWSLSRLVDPTRAVSLESRQLALVALDQAEQAARQGHYEEARQQIRAAMSSLQQVRDQDGRGVLAAQVKSLEQQLPGGSSPPPLGTPPVSEVPLPPGTPSPPGTPLPSSPPAPSSPPSPSASGPEPTSPPTTSQPSDGGTSPSGAPSDTGSSTVAPPEPPVPTVALPGTPIAVVADSPGGPALPVGVTERVGFARRAR